MQTHFKPQSLLTIYHKTESAREWFGECTFYVFANIQPSAVSSCPLLNSVAKPVWITAGVGNLPDPAALSIVHLAFLRVFSHMKALYHP